MKDQKGYYHPEVIAKREELQREISTVNKLVIDRSVFQKTPEEKLESKLAKQAYKKQLKNYGQH